MTNLTKTTCALYGCNKAVQNWRTVCCSKSHQSAYAAKKRHETENKPNKSKKDIVAYHRQWSIEKQKRTKSATPSWANKEKIKEIYIQAVKLSESTGVRHEVDHIIPLTSKLVCGLHNEFNLQILPMVENRIKSNKFFAE
jgi:alpha-mannosidase